MMIKLFCKTTNNNKLIDAINHEYLLFQAHHFYHFRELIATIFLTVNFLMNNLAISSF